MVCAAESTVAVVFIEGRLREKTGTVQRCPQPGAGHNYQTDHWTTVHYRNVNMPNLHICKAFSLTASVVLGFRHIRPNFFKQNLYLQRCDNNKVCSEWVTALVESLAPHSNGSDVTIPMYALFSKQSIK